MSEKRVRSIPGIRPPVALLTRARSAACRPSVFLGSDTTDRNPSSIRDDSVRPSAAALRRARLSSSSGRRIVVRLLIYRDYRRIDQISNRSLEPGARPDGGGIHEAEDRERNAER